VSDLTLSCTHCGARSSCPDSVARIYAGRQITRWCESCRRLFDVEFPPNRTLSDLIFGTPHPPLVSEREWVTLVQAVASGNEDALRTLYERMHRIVYRFLVTFHEWRDAEREPDLREAHVGPRALHLLVIAEHPEERLDDIVDRHASALLSGHRIAQEESLGRCSS
jgi:hypothetical protein